MDIRCRNKARKRFTTSCRVAPVINLRALKVTRVCLPTLERSLTKMTYVFAASVFACIRQVAVVGVINFSIENIAPIYQFRPVWATV